MGDTKEQNNNQPKGKEAGPTQSFDGSVAGPGGQIGQFRIERELGRGGAGVVYLAHDTKLNRSVAIKSLPAELAENPKARTRFAREARVLASLNHPNIATIYDEFQKSEGIGYLILEYVPGRTLAERIVESKLKLKESLTIASQIAEAVAAAHEHGVIHRDLKPRNIKITPEGKVKVLDFGLAKALVSESKDLQSTVTEPGRIIGTPAYMSPEQASGQSTDKRSDIWAFGCVLYEMLTGKVPFEGETVSDTLANILQIEPDWHALPDTIPTNIQILLRRCLEKDPRQRLRDIGDAGIEISETLTDSGSDKLVTFAGPELSKSAKWWRMTVWSVVCILLGALTASVITWNLKRPLSASLSSFPISLPRNQKLIHEITVSPDGKRLVYAAGVSGSRQLFLREVDQFMSRELPETKDAWAPFFSPDGQLIGFGAGGKLKTLSLDGGRPKTLCDAKDFVGGCWGPDGVIYFSPTATGGIWKISAEGGVPEQVTTPEKEKCEFSHWWPEVLPGGEVLLFTVWNSDLDDFTINVLSLKTGKWQTLLVGGSHARYAPTGHLLYAQSGALMAAPFDIKKLKVGKPRRIVVENINQQITNGCAPFCFSQNGLLYYIRGGDWLARQQLVWVNRRGDEVGSLPLPLGAYKNPRLSPDGLKLAYTEFRENTENIWVYDLPNGPATQRTFETSNFLALWRLPDGDSLAFTSYRAGPFDVYWMPANWSSPEESLLAGPYDQIATSWSPDGKALLFTESNPDTGYDIGLLSTEDSNTPQLLLHETWDELNAIFSPDGNWIAYQSNSEGPYEVYVMPYPELVPKKISTRGGCNPAWSMDGKELFYRVGDKMIAVSIETESEFKVTGSEVLFEISSLAWTDDWCRNYDISDDGMRFLMVKQDEEESAANQLVVVLNWFEELKRLVTIGRD